MKKEFYDLVMKAITSTREWKITKENRTCDVNESKFKDLDEVYKTCELFKNNLYADTKIINVNTANIMLIEKNGKGYISFQDIERILIQACRSMMGNDIVTFYIDDIMKELRDMQYQYLYNTNGVILGLIVDEISNSVLEKDAVMSIRCI